MKSRSWSIRLTVLLILVFPFISSRAQTDPLAGNPINLAPDINKKIAPFPLNDKVNSNYVETGPLTSSTGKRLYYSRYGHPSNTGGTNDIDIWYNEFIDSTQSWSESINIGAPLNNAGPNFVFEVGWTDDSLLVANRYDKKGHMKAGLSFSVWDGKTWSVPSPVHVKNDYNLAENVGYDLSPYRNVLLISEEKEDSKGKTDIYVSFRDRSAAQTTTESFNLGEVINTGGSERSPFLTDDTMTLYFASDGHNGYGKLDIFKSHRLDDTWTNWSKPENLGPGINTPFDDRSFAFATSSRCAYYSRGINTTRSDIYGIPLSELFAPEMADIKGLTSKATATKPGQTFTLNDAFPAEGTSLTDPTQADLKQIAEYMSRVKNLEIFVSVHSTTHPTRSESHAISDKRLLEVKNYLASHGVVRSRIMGESDGHDVAHSRPYLANAVEFRFINKVVIHTAPKK